MPLTFGRKILEMKRRKQWIPLAGIMLGVVIASGPLSAEEPSKEQATTISQRQGKILERIATGNILEGVHGLGKITGPWFGRRGEVVPDTLSILDSRFTIETALKEHSLLVALEETILSRYFSGKQIKVIGRQLRYPGSSFSVTYYQDGWLGEFTLSLRDTKRGFEAWVVDHAQAQKGLNGEQFEGVDVKKSLERARHEREDIRREAEERIRAARKNPIAEQGGAEEPATRAESDSEGSDKPQPESGGRSR
jgi:hypothetical protein